MNIFREYINRLENSPNEVKAIQADLLSRDPDMEWSEDPETLAEELSLWVELDEMPVPTDHDLARDRSKLSSIARKFSVSGFIRSEAERLDGRAAMLTDDHEDDEEWDAISWQRHILTTLAASQ